MTALAAFAAFLAALAVLSPSPASAAASQRSVFYSYDVMGRQLSAKFDSAGGADGVVNTYDGFGEVKSTTLTMGTFSKTLSSTYDAAGNRVQLTHPDNNSFAYCYDALGRLSGIGQGASCTTTPLESFTYGTNGLVSKRAEGAGAGVSSASYGYDDIGRLTSQSDVFASATNANDVNWGFTINPASEIASEARTIPNSTTTDPYAFSGLVAVNRNYGVNGLNQYTSAGTATFAYDGNGNLTSDGTNSYTYDVENRLVKAVSGTTTVNLTYDPLGRLFQVDKGTTTTTTRFLTDGDALVLEYNGTTTPVVKNRYVHGSNAAADDPLVWYSGANLLTVQYLHADHLGSIVGIAGSTGAIITNGANAYDEYGINDSGNNQTERFGYTGQAFIPELGMYYYKARMYSPTLGRFMQTDPVGYKDQINLYEYVGDDPVDHEDPSGMGPGDWGLGSLVESFKEDPIGTTANAIDAVTDVVIAVETIGTAGASAGGPDEAELGVERASTTGLRSFERSEVQTADRAGSRATGPYQRPSGATTRAQRESVQGRPCAICGKTTERQVAGHKEALVKEHHETGAIDKQRMRSLGAVRPECPTCSAKEGAKLSRYSKQMNEQFPK